MRHRHISNPFTRSGNDQHGNNHTPLTEPPYFPTGRGIAPENGPFVGQMNHMARGGVPEGRANEYVSSSVGMDIQPYVPRPPTEPYSNSSITENRSLVPVGPIYCTNYDVPSMRDVSNGGSHKRKRSDSFYSAGSSSSSSQMPMEKDCHGVPPYRGSLTIRDEDSSRNVRRRYRIDLEPGMTRPLVPSRSQFYHSTHGQHSNLDANCGHWNSAPDYSASSHRRILPSDINGPRHEMNQFHIGGSSSDAGAARHRDSFFSRPPISSLHGPHPPPVREDSVINHSRIAEPSYGNGSRYPHYTHGANSANGLHTPPDSFSSRNSRHYSPRGWRGSYRSGRPRLTVDRFPHALDTSPTESHDGMGHEAIMMVDRAPFYGSSRSFSDQYRDLRLDIDNMSYEELLNLEERIGNVSTGLSEDSISKCLSEQVHCSLDQSNEEVSCPICLEDYKNGDKIGMMEKCKHAYHVDCIKKWLLMKKVCPICKTECSN
uniref:probable E3 ubiquitin-protein ligase RHG1A n=1 Tax=Erigeron canadensis TaxID=72917 RepID=UPI001CB986E4|nr:probable E3 ubiquitin-protein ligase RHG1A [Erigeron canadensis]XP_043631138.1 probable E3 ubiquitin-protein ligase RHG1A [Erigeron canadensis]